MRESAALVVVALLPAAFGWTDRWDHSKRFNAAGHAQLDCDGESRPASCCICRSIVFEIETQLNNTQARILEVLDDVCKQVPLELPDSNHKAKRMLSAACSDFVGEYEDELTRTFFDDFTPAKDRMCGRTLQVCPQPDKTAKHEDL
ncbi:hypothetical protein AM587_10017649 [Phytophthora nicotianae]|uniref:Saposin B-type domain-containing protein n=1 Tax=Phytophthora nicotianae TaxID=4792 RepID=A0A0W8C7D6_PHYNI|nr:hypothetical protein AM587_10017649 [Phytophthora nicotianae]